MLALWTGNISDCQVLVVKSGCWVSLCLHYLVPHFTEGCEVAHLHLIRSQTQTSAHENSRTFTAALLNSYSKHAPTPSAYFKRQALIIYGCELVNSLESHALEFDDVSKEGLLKTG